MIASQRRCTSLGEFLEREATGVAIDAVASLDLRLTDDEAAALEASYTPRNDFQGVSDDADLARISAKLGIKLGIEPALT